MGAEESTATHVEVYPAVSRQPSISSGSHSGQEHMVISLLSLSFYFIFFGKKWKNYSVNAFSFLFKQIHNIRCAKDTAPGKFKN